MKRIFKDKIVEYSFERETNNDIDQMSSNKIYFIVFYILLCVLLLFFLFWWWYKTGFWSSIGIRSTSFSGSEVAYLCIQQKDFDEIPVINSMIDSLKKHLPDNPISFRVNFEDPIICPDNIAKYVVGVFLPKAVSAQEYPSFLFGQFPSLSQAFAVSFPDRGKMSRSFGRYKCIPCFLQITSRRNYNQVTTPIIEVYNYEKGKTVFLQTIIPQDGVLKIYETNWGI